jgi:hypothetical protein
MKKVACKDCRHFREAPYQAPLTGCWHPDHMLVTQKEAFLDEQQAPGNHRKINLRGDCSTYEERERPPKLWQRIFSMGA